MTQTWHELLFAHWPIAPDALRPLVPSILPLDTYEGQCWVGIVPFHMSNVRPRWVPPLPKLSRFVELNVRTYVTLHGISGVYFFSLDASNPIAVALARTFFHLPYFNALMSTERLDDTIHYSSRRNHRGAPQKGVLQARRQIGGADRLRHAHPRPPGNAGISIGHIGRRLFRVREDRGNPQIL